MSNRRLGHAVPAAAQVPDRSMPSVRPGPRLNGRLFDQFGEHPGTGNAVAVPKTMTGTRTILNQPKAPAPVAFSGAEVADGTLTITVPTTSVHVSALR